MKKFPMCVYMLILLLGGCSRTQGPNPVGLQPAVSKPSWGTVQITRDPAWLIPYVVLPEPYFHIEKATDKPKISESNALKTVEDMAHVPPYPKSINIYYADSTEE